MSSKARLVLTALFVDQQGVAEVVARYGVHRSWVYRLKARYEAEGPDAFEPRSRRPAGSPHALEPATVALILERDSMAPGWMPARTPSPGTWTSTTRPRSPDPPSPGT